MPDNHNVRSRLIALARDLHQAGALTFPVVVRFADALGTKFVFRLREHEVKPPVPPSPARDDNTTLTDLELQILGVLHPGQEMSVKAIAKALDRSPRDSYLYERLKVLRGKGAIVKGRVGYRKTG